MRPMEPLEPMRPMEPLEPMRPMRPMDRPMDQAGYSYMYRDTLTHSTLPKCTRNGAAKSTPDKPKKTRPPTQPLGFPKNHFDDPISGFFQTGARIDLDINAFGICIAHLLLLKKMRTIPAAAPPHPFRKHECCNLTQLRGEQ